MTTEQRSVGLAGTGAGQDIELATSRDTKVLASMLARAFCEDPAVNWIVKPGPRQAESREKFFSLLLTYLGFPNAMVMCPPDRSGAAIVFAPGTWGMSLAEQARYAREFMQVVGLVRAPKVFAGMAAMERKHPRWPHYYLCALGVDPGMQGRGLGSALMRPALLRCDREGVGAYLETSLEHNVRAWQRHGFRVVEDWHIPYGGPRLFLMWREPKPT